MDKGKATRITATDLSVSVRSTAKVKTKVDRAVIPVDAAAEVLTKVAAVAAREESIRARIHAGETTLEIFGLDP